MSFLQSLFGKKEEKHQPKRKVELMPLPQTDEEKETFLKRYFDTLVAHGWNLIPAEEDSSPEIIQNGAEGRLAHLDKDVIRFFSSFKSLFNDGDSVWFNSLTDFSKKAETDDTCTWNHFEREDLERVDTDDEKKVIERFWGNHLPVLYSYVMDESSITIVLTGEDAGKIVLLNEGIYEDAEIIATDFFRFLQLHCYSVELGTVKSPLAGFI